MINKNLKQNNVEETLVRKEIKSKKQPFLAKHWVSFTIISAASITTAIMMYLLLVKLEIETTENYVTITYVKKKAEPKFFSSLSHNPVMTEDEIDSPITAVMIENHPDARPQSGLADAEMVFEAVAEGGITRFVALYQTNTPKMIGPVRSLRKYYIDWTKPFNPSVAHVGGSAEALAIIRNGQHRDIDQFFNSKYYWRSNDRYAPHNVYTNKGKLDALNKSKNYHKSMAKTFKRQAEPSAKELKPATVTNIEINLSSPLYNVEFKYRADSNDYLRYMAGKPHLDREAGNITPKTIIAIVNQTTLNADGKHMDIVTTGTGKAFIFQNGQVEEATWSKPNIDSQIEFTDKNGQKIAINYGQVWISSVANNASRVKWN